MHRFLLIEGYDQVKSWLEQQYMYILYSKSQGYANEEDAHDERDYGYASNAFSGYKREYCRRARKITAPPAPG